MTIIIADSSALILLEKIGLLGSIVGIHSIIIPEEVYKEAILRGLENQHHDALELNKKVSERLIRIMRVNDLAKVFELTRDFGLEKGEAEAISLLIGGKGDVIAVDDLKAMKYCDRFNLPFVTTINLVMDVLERKIINKAEAKMAIKNLAIYGRYSNEIIFSAFEKLEGGKNG